MLLHFNFQGGKIPATLHPASERMFFSQFYAVTRRREVVRIKLAHRHRRTKFCGVCSIRITEFQWFRYCPVF